MEQIGQTISCPQPTTFLPKIDVGAIARIVATKTASVDIPAQLLFLPGQYLLVTRVESVVTYKFLAPEAVTAAFANEPIDSRWLPTNTVRWGHNHQGEWTVQFYPPGRYQLLLSNFGVETVTISVPMPAFVFLGHGNDYWLWAVLEKQFDPSCQLYHAPLPNVMSSGAICFGENSPPQCSLTGIVQAWQMFWNSPFNDHVVSGKSKSHPTDVRKHLYSLHNRKSKRYPTQDLVSLSNKTVKCVVEQILRC